MFELSDPGAPGLRSCGMEEYVALQFDIFAGKEAWPRSGSVGRIAEQGHVIPIHRDEKSPVDFLEIAT
jgi:hypothetical protein